MALIKKVGNPRVQSFYSLLEQINCFSKQNNYQSSSPTSKITEKAMWRSVFWLYGIAYWMPIQQKLSFPELHFYPFVLFIITFCFSEIDGTAWHPKSYIDKTIWPTFVKIVFFRRTFPSIPYNYYNISWYLKVDIFMSTGIGKIGIVCQR